MSVEASHPSSRASFVIAIICPLSLEAQVAIPLFDTVYDRTVYEKYGPVRNDPNHYTLGRIGRYDVVLAHMGGCGKAEASSVASHIKQSYPDIELALLIGICGGVPYRTNVGPTQPRRDVFLGDVIVSGAIIQYDLGKKLPHRFVRKKTLESNLGRASQQIRTFISTLEARHKEISKDHRKYLQTIQNSKDVPYPEPNSDILFKPEYKHRSHCQCMRVVSGDESVVDRRRVDSDKIPYIHFGRLASGDTVMCSAKDRDKIAKREEVLGFEMEAAGVWDSVPCILIKGAQYRLDEILDAHDTTCAWVLERPEFKTWMCGEDLKSHGGFFWIKGKPGAGKSTLMKYLLPKAKRSKSDTVITSFFFHAQGVDLERSTVGMYRSLLHQLLSSTAISSSAKQPYFNLAAKMLSQDDGITWTIRDLKHQLLTIIRSLTNRYVFVFIDALDECDQGEMGDMIPFLEHLGHSSNACGVHLRIYLASRHYPQLNIKRGIELVLEYQQEQQGDMRKYVETKLRGGKSKMIQEIREEIYARAAGVFLWVTLVVRSLNDALPRANFTPDLTFCLQLVLFAHRPLSRDELYFAVMFAKDGLIKRDGEWHIDPHIENFILNISKGLVETARSKSRTVHFIHESVRDFLLRRNGFSRLQAGLGANAPRMIFQNSMLLHVQHKIKYVESEAPFLDYAIHSLLPHSNAAEAAGTSQDAFLETFSLSFHDFKDIRNALEPYHTRPYRTKVTALYVLAELNLDHLIRLELLRTPPLWKETGRYHSSMGAAVYAGNTLAIRALLGCDPIASTSADNSLLKRDVIDRMKHYVVGSKQIRMRSGHSMALFLVEYAIERGHVAVLKLLQQTGEIDLNYGLNNGYLPLIYAVRCTKAEIFEFLLGNAGVNRGNRDARIRLALRIAISEGKRDISNVLLNHAMSRHWVNSFGECAFHWAVAGNDGPTVRRLIGLGCNVANRDGSGRDALSHAAEQGKVEMVRILIESGMVDIDGKDDKGRTAFSWAAGPDKYKLNHSPKPKQDWDELQKEVMYVLLSTGCVDVSSRDGYQWTPLFWAVKEDKPVAVDILLEASDTEVDCKRLTGKTSLSVAAVHGAWTRSHATKTPAVWPCGYQYSG
ncbi:vegetative incompatibility protein HET-E-1 [Aspergillus awamori]|uniref:Vegetative incompatibility protein HET-E-1 n=1 Tax=Aspergillus awamori TaxID=105351 RepID=A0A401KPY6_ASPAW|nr:vegetative incompatibility protein HET-E-1 [Aspergillus awamori]